MATKESYLKLFNSKSEAVEFENQVLSVDHMFLPDCALKVLAGEESSEEYWEWLSNQVVLTTFEEGV